MRLRYIGLLASVFVVAWWGSVEFGTPLDNDSYDQMFQRYQPTAWTPESVVLAIDEQTLEATPGGMTHIRGSLAQALRLVDAAPPKAVVVDLILTDQRDPAEDQALADAFRVTPNLVLSSMMLPDRWERVMPEFARSAVAIGHVAAQPDPSDSVTRVLPLDKHIGHEQRWAIALEAFRLSRSAGIVESPDDLQVGSTIIPFKRTPDNGRLMRIRYRPSGVPIVSLHDLLNNPENAKRDFAGKVVFVGVTAPSEVRDRLFTPYSSGYIMTGIEIHANAFETMAQGLFLTDAPETWVLLWSVALAAAAGFAFAYLPGWTAYAAGLAIVLVSWFTPYAFFTHRIVFPLATSAGPVTACAIAAAAWQHLVVRRSLVRAETDRARYQQAMHFVTHEMRTPLSAIQGSSELISRYALTEEKRKQIAGLINSESKRLARMIEVFLNVERLSAGEMELKREDILIKPMVDTCLDRARPLAERKHITLKLEPIPDDLRVAGDRELMEYACYNLLTNAVKYSPQQTEVTVSGWRDDGRIRVAVKDQGIGMDQKEIKKIFQKFYRTRRAEESGEAGTGIGLSIVQQIVEQHGGQIDVVSQPGAGSCFTLVLPSAAGRVVGADLPTAVQKH
jgi:signal transduction histidine kinase